MVKKLLILIFSALMSGQIDAQRTPLEKYQQAPAVFYQAYLDFVQDFHSSRINTTGGQYIGQIAPDKQFYGFGSYNDESGQRVGFFRNGAYEFGIAITANSAIVGTATEHVAYSLSTGRMEYIMSGGERMKPDTKTVNDYAFVSMTYANGDRYMGETYLNRRHGFGIYHYATGGFWFGQYDKGACQGPGCLFRPDDTMRIGYYLHGYEQRMYEVLPRNRKK